MEGKKTITLRLEPDIYEMFASFAKQDRRSISNCVETLALNMLEEKMFTDDAETMEIFSDKDLRSRLKEGHKQIADGDIEIIG